MRNHFNATAEIKQLIHDIKVLKEDRDHWKQQAQIANEYGRHLEQQLGDYDPYWWEREKQP